MSFDLVGELAPPGALTVYATTQRRLNQTIGAPLQASAIVTGDGFVATVNFRAGERFAEVGSFRVSGTHGVVTQVGLSLGGDSVVVHNSAGTATIPTSDDWFTHGLAGAMAAMLEAVGSASTPPHSAESAMKGTVHRVRRRGVGPFGAPDSGRYRADSERFAVARDGLRRR